MATRKMTVEQELAQLHADYAILQRRYNEVYDSAPVGYYTLDASGRILDVNETAGRQFGSTPSALRHDTFQSHVIKADAQRLQAFLQEAFTRSNHRLEDVRLKKAHNSCFYAQIESLRLPDEPDASPRYRLTVSDMTPLHEARNMLLRREGELALFNRVSQVLTSSYDLDQILVLLMDEVRRLLEVTACSIWLIEPEIGELVCRQAIGPHRDTILGWRLAVGQGIAGWVAGSGQSLLVNNTTADGRHFDGVDEVTGEPLHSILCVPMHAQQEVIGVLQVLDSQSNRFTDMDQTLQELLATIASIAIENARLREQVHQDAKTRRLLLADMNRQVAGLLSDTPAGENQELTL